MRNLRTARYRPWLAAVGGAVLMLVAAAPTTFAAPWPVSPNSDNAEIISQLFWFTLVLAAIVFVLVEGLLIYSSLRFRRRAPIPEHEPPQIHGNTRLEVMWAIVPALILIGLFGITVTRLGVISRTPDHRPVHHVRPASSSRGTFGYTDAGVNTTNDLRRFRSARRSSSTSPRKM